MAAFRTWAFIFNILFSSQFLVASDDWISDLSKHEDTPTSPVPAPQVFQDLQGICGRRSNEIKVTCGTIANRNEFPWQVFITVVPFSETLFKGSSCSGSLITNQWILTHKDCVQIIQSDVVSPTVVYLRAHNLTLSNNQDNRLVASLDDGGSWISGNLRLFKLKIPIEFTDTIRPICLPWNTTESYDYQRGLITGWGRLNDTMNDQVLRKALTTIIPNSLCWSIYDDLINSSNICTLGLDGVGPCGLFDDGLPLSVVSSDGIHTQVGVQSNTPYFTSCNVRQPHVYTRIEPYLEWIASVVDPSSSQHLQAPTTLLIFLLIFCFVA